MTPRGDNDADQTRGAYIWSGIVQAAKNLCIAAGVVSLGLIGLRVAGFTIEMGGSDARSATVTQSDEPVTADEGEEPSARQAAIPDGLNARWLSGSWILVPTGGEDGQTKCSDFDNPAIYRLNNLTSKIMTFRPNGEYRSLFSYTTPSGGEHSQIEVGNWQVRDERLELLDVAIVATPFGGEVGDVSAQAEPTGAHTLQLDDGRYVRCVGNADEIYGVYGE